MQRRRLLSLSGVCLAGIAGCLSESTGSNAPTTTGMDGSPAAAPTESATPTPGDPAEKNGVRVEDIVVRKAVTYESTMGSGGVLAEQGTQYVVASVHGDREERPAFVFETDARSWEPGVSGTVGARNRSVADHGGGPVGGRISEDGSYLVFSVSSPLSGSNPRIRLTGEDGAAWPLPSAHRQRLAAPAPRFELQRLSVPDTVSQGEDLAVSLTVENTSEVDGRFLAAVYWPTEYVADDDESHVVDRDVAAGETTTATLQLDTRFTATESGPVTLSVDGCVSAERTVQLRDVSDPF